MNHRKSHTVKKIGKDYKHKKSILKSLSCDIIRHEKVKTTKAKAKLVRSFLEKIIHRAKVDTLHNRREVYKKIRNTKVLKKLFENIAKRYETRNGGYLRIVQYGQRKGDAAEICYVMLTEEILVNKKETTDKNQNSPVVDKKLEEKSRGEDDTMSKLVSSPEGESVQENKKSLSTEEEKKK